MAKKLFIYIMLLILMCTTGCGIQESRIIHELQSPTGEFIAIYYDDSDGILEGHFTYALSINKTSKPRFLPYRQKNVLRTDTYINFVWTDDYELTITATSGRREVFVQKNPPNNVNVIYEFTHLGLDSY